MCIAPYATRVVLLQLRTRVAPSIAFIRIGGREVCPSDLSSVGPSILFTCPVRSRLGVRPSRRFKVYLGARERSEGPKEGKQATRWAGRTACRCRSCRGGGLPLPHPSLVRCPSKFHPRLHVPHPFRPPDSVPPPEHVGFSCFSVDSRGTESSY